VIPQIKSSYDILVRNSRFILGQGVTIAQPILMLILLTRIMDQSNYGSYAKLIMYSGILLPVVSLNFSEWNLREALNRSSHHAGALFTQGLLISSVISVALFMIGILLQGRLPGLSLPHLIVLTLSQSWIALIRTQFVILNKTRRFFVFGIIQLGITIIPIWLSYVVWSELCFETVLFLLTSANFLSTIIGIRLARIRIQKPSRDLKSCFQFLLPLVLFSLVAYLGNTADRVFASEYLTPDAFALYHSNFQIAFFFMAFTRIVQTGWARDVFEQKTSIVNVKDTLFKLLFTMLILGLGYALFTPILASLLLPIGYTLPLKLALTFIIGGWLQLIYFLAKPFVLLRGRTRNLLYNSIASMCVSWTYIFCVSYYGNNMSTQLIAYAYPLGWLVMATLTLRDAWDDHS
jgi:O-antigen/teichoic acid export membrane protein